MENINKMNADRMRNAEEVIAGLRVQGPDVAAELEGLLFEGRPARKVALGELFELLADALQRSNELLRVADAAHTAETSGDIDARSERDAAASALRDAVTFASRAIAGVFGPSVASSMGLDVVWAGRPDMLLAQARNAVALMRKERKLEARAPGLKADAQVMADHIAQRCDSLETTLDVMKREERAAQRTLQEREIVARDWERLYPGIAEVFTGLCIMTRRDALAARVKPTARRTRGEARKARARAVEPSTGASTAPSGAAPSAEEVVTH